MKKVLLALMLTAATCFVACKVPSWVSTVEGIAQIAVPIAGSIVDIIDPALAPLVTAIEGGFTALTKTLDAYKAAPTATNLQAVQAAFAAVNANVTQLEAAAQIKNTATDAKVTAIVGLLAQAVNSIAAQLPQPPAAAGKVGALPVGATADDLKKQFNNIVSGDSRFKPL